MKNILFCLLFMATSFVGQSQDRWLYWKYKDFDGSISVTVPRLMFTAGSAFGRDQEERKLIRKVHKVRTLVFQDGNPMSERDMRRFNRKAKRRNLDEIITVREGKTRVQIMARERRGALRKIVVFVNDPEDGFVMVSLKGKFKMKDVNRLIKKFNKSETPVKIPLYDRAAVGGAKVGGAV